MQPIARKASQVWSFTTPSRRRRMTRYDRIQMHSTRAMQELDWGLRAGNERAARAHFDLSALHLDSLRALKVDAASR